MMGNRNQCEDDKLVEGQQADITYIYHLYLYIYPTSNLVCSIVWVLADKG